MAQSYRPHRPHLMWANPILTTPDPVTAALKRLFESRLYKQFKRRVANEKDASTKWKKRPAAVKWADPIATVADDGKPHGYNSRHVVWKNPIATIAETGEVARRKTQVVGEREKVVFRRKRAVNGKLVWVGTHGCALAMETRSPEYRSTQGRSPPPGPFFRTGCAKAAPTTALSSDEVHLDVASSPRMGDERGVPDFEAMPVKSPVPTVVVQDVDAEAEDRLGRLVRKWKYEYAWMCDFDEKPFEEEELLLLQQKFRVRKAPSKPAPCYACGLVCGLAMLILGVIVSVFCG